MEYTGIDFSVYLPKAYCEERKGIVTHHMFMDEGSDRIRALIDTYPIKLKLDELVINASYIGTVAVHPRFRNMGLFSRLLRNVEDDAVSKDLDLLILDGERSRYSNFGYEKAGIKYSFNIEYKSALSLAKDNTPYEFEEVDKDSLLIDKMYELYSRRNVTARDKGDFYISLLSMHASTFAVIKNGRIIGYVNLSENEKNVNEFELEDKTEIPKLMRDLMDGFGMDKLVVSVGVDETDKIKYLESVSDYYNVSTSHQVRILNYEKVVGFLLRWKQKYSNLPNGEYIFGIITEKKVTNYKVTVKNPDVFVTKTEDKADDVFTEKEFVKVILTGYFYVEYEKTIKAPTGWFPLPFFLPAADTF
jgi:predicted acetyltransferase